jgi:AraC-like DNA-binding protein
MQVSILMVRALVGVVERNGASRDRFFAAAKLDPGVLEDPNAWLPLGTYQHSIGAALSVSGDRAFGLHMGEHASPAMFDVLGPLAETAATMREGIEAMTRYSRLVAEGFEPRLHEDGESASIRFAALRGDLDPVRLTAEFAMTALLQLLRVFAGHRAKPSRVSFAYPAPAYVAEYRRIFGEAAHFDEPFTEMRFPRAWLDRLQLYRSPDLYSHLKTRAENTLGRLERESTQTARVEQMLAAQSPRQVSMDEVAGELGISRRSLRRHLAAEGTSFAELAERSRIDAAKRMLEHRGSSIQETAYALGFAAPAAFHRAFKRWTGMTPKQYQASF